MSSPFDIIGFIQDATVDAPGDVFSGGTISVNGTKVIIPRNTVLQMPAATLAWQEVFAKAPAGYAPKRSGLAMNDVPTPASTYEVHIMGNRVVSGTSDQFIASLVFLSQQSLNAGADSSTSSITRPAGTARRVTTSRDDRRACASTIDRPVRASEFTDVRFSIDEESPTIRSETAFQCVCRGRIRPSKTMRSVRHAIGRKTFSGSS